MVAWRLAQASRRVEGIGRCLTLPSYCRERAGRDLDLSASFLYRLHQPRHCQCCHHQNVQYRKFRLSPPQLFCVKPFAVAVRLSPFAFFAVRIFSPLAVCTTKMDDSSRAVDTRTKRVEPHQQRANRLQQPSKYASGPTQSKNKKADRRRNLTTGSGRSGKHISPSLSLTSAETGSTKCRRHCKSLMSYRLTQPLTLWKRRTSHCGIGSGGRVTSMYSTLLLKASPASRSSEST